MVVKILAFLIACLTGCLVMAYSNMENSEDLDKVCKEKIKRREVIAGIIGVANSIIFAVA